MANKYLLIFRSTNSYKELERLIYILIVHVAFLLVVSFSECSSKYNPKGHTIIGNNDKEADIFSFTFESDKNTLDQIYIFIFSLILCLVLCCLKLMKKQTERRRNGHTQ